MPERSLSSIAPKEAHLGAGVLLFYSGRLCLVLDEKNIWADGIPKKAFRISAIGGGLDLDEDFLACAKRECVEETGVSPEIESARRTIFVDYDNSVKAISVSDRVKPAIVFRRVYLKGPESWQLFAAAYIGRAHSRPEPVETEGLIFSTLPGIRAIQPGTRLRDVISQEAHVVSKKPLPQNLPIFPFGTVEAMRAIDLSRKFSLASILKNKSPA